MRHKLFNLFLAAVCCGGAGLAARAQDPNQETVRGAFLETRVSVSAGSGGVSASASAGATGAPARKPKRKATSYRPTAAKSATTTPARSTTARNTGRNKNSTPPVTGTSTKTPPVTSDTRGATTPAGAVKALTPVPVGLGYSLFMRTENGEAVRVDPFREFHTGDRVRLVLESNVDGYLYIFHSENGGAPTMIYPDARLEDGYNAIDAHVPMEIPSSRTTDERLAWFNFTGAPATERLYIVLTREPLPGVPTDENLVKYCRQNERCEWRPAPEMLNLIRVNAEAKVGVVKNSDSGTPMTSGEKVALTRGLGLDSNAPAPSVIRMNATSETGMLVTAIDLIHK